MHVYIRFNSDGIQTEAIQRNNSPEDDWQPAPAGFSWEKRYKLVENKVVEMTATDQAAEQLRIQKDLMLSNLQQQLHTILDQNSTVPVSDIPLKMVEARAAQTFLDTPEDPQAQAALQPLAAVWNLSLEATAQKLITEAQTANRLLLLARTYQEKAVLEIKDIDTVDALEIYHKKLMTDFEQEVHTILQGDAHA